MNARTRKINYTPRMSQWEAFEACSREVRDAFHDGAEYVATEPGATLEQAVTNICDGQYENVIAVVCFNPVECLSRDVSEDIAQAICQRAWAEGERPGDAACNFMGRHSLDYPPDPEFDADDEIADERHDLRAAAE